jgi:ribonuclease HI
MDDQARFDEVTQSELSLLSPPIRRDPQLIRELLHPDFVEFGTSGRIWDTESIVQALTTEVDPVEIKAFDFVPTSLSADSILLTYTCESGERKSLRSSIWTKNEVGKWVLLFHQGTIVGTGNTSSI